MNYKMSYKMENLIFKISGFLATLEVTESCSNSEENTESCDTTGACNILHITERGYFEHPIALIMEKYIPERSSYPNIIPFTHTIVLCCIIV